MSQKVHPKGFRLRSTGHLSPFQHPIDTKESSILTSYSKASFETSDRVEHQGKLPKAVSETFKLTEGKFGTTKGSFSSELINEGPSCIIKRDY